ncbi:ketopantoate reductase family protein [Umezawaea sp. Da 62-37]|uniref:ketopantoate reductase family protein n=1 Tax=Umezawaea sp. Da 62-37 TaxID=3075927 RepID=UPI0028F704E5|nr:ketopantoate reductase family protein [Umezawaea sp. Da 62-37]WNV88450.1 ketopantoate reductase family protein [Umezawaea sp. Da 62-37]
MKILVVGAGATGGYFGARLVQAGRDVTFLVRQGRAGVLRKRGLRIVEADGETVVEPNLVEVEGLTGTYDLILLSVKATALDAAIRDFAPAVRPGTLILPVLNGMGHIEALVERFGEGAVLGGAARVVTTLNDEGDIVRIGGPHLLTYGARSKPAPEGLAAVEEALTGVGFDAVLYDDIVEDMWAKWAFITSIGAVTCLMRGSIGEVAAVPGGVGFAEAVITEAAGIVAAAGHPIPEAALEFMRSTVTTPGSPLTSSLYRDLVAGQQVEVEALFGDLLVVAERVGVPAPLLGLTTGLLRVHQARVTGRE